MIYKKICELAYMGHVVTLKNHMKDILERNSLIKSPKIGDIIEGKIINSKRGSLFIDLGPIGAGIIFGKEFNDARNSLRGLKFGDNIFVKVVDLDNEEGYVELSLSQAGKEMSWDGLKEKKELGEIITVNISSANKGGLLTEVSGIPGFLPVSQLSLQNYPRVEGGDSTKILRELQKFVGQDMQVRVFAIDPREGKLILSEKAKETEKIKEILQKYKVGDIIDGEITGLVDFGAFIKFPVPESVENPSIEGLIHISELDWSIVADPSEIVKIGDIIKAKVIEIKDDKVSLSLKSLKQDPWSGIDLKHKKGDIIKGKVTKFNPFGAFVQIEPRIQGLCHISEFGTKVKMEELLQIDKDYDFEILEIRPEEHRMSLKIKEK